jgi:hypothetical protein
MKELVQSFYLEDGCKAEKRIVENSIGDGHGETITEIHAEKPMPKYLKQRVIERQAPVVVEREVQVYDENGNMTSTKEAVDHELKVYDTPKAVYDIKQAEPQISTDLVAACIARAVQPIRDQISGIQSQIDEMRSEAKRDNCTQNSVSMQSLVGEKLAEEKKVNITGWDIAGVAIILAQLGAVGYFVCFLF